MAESAITQAINHSEPPTAKQFRANLKEIFDSETTFGSARAARLDLLESALDIIQEYLKHGCRIVYLHGKLKEAGYTGSRKELCEWLIAKGLREKREASGKRKEIEVIHDSETTENVTLAEEGVEDNESADEQSGVPAPEESEGSQPDEPAPEDKGKAEAPENQAAEETETKIIPGPDSSGTPPNATLASEVTPVSISKPKQGPAISIRYKN